MEWRLEALTSPEVKERIAQGTDTAVFPIGSVEQHGHHCPLGTDGMTSDRVAREVADRLKALCLPPLPYGVAPHHMRFAGTITVRPEILTQLTEDILLSVIHHGIKKVLILNGHGGNTPAVRIAGFKVRERHPDVFVAYSSVWLALHDGYDELPERLRQFDWKTLAAHAGLIETALVMAIDEKLVKKDRAVVKPVDRFTQAGDPAMTVIARIEELTEVGSAGDPAPADAEIGKMLLEKTVDRIVAKFNAALGTFCPGAR